MEDYFIPLNTQCELQERADAFLINYFPKVKVKIAVVCRGKFIFLRRYDDFDDCQNLGRLTYSGDIQNMPFAIFRFKTQKYDPKGNFLGSDHLNGTIEGAISAILAAYP